MAENNNIEAGKNSVANRNDVNNTENGTENKTAPRKKYEILNQFIKDLSFEAPNSPKIFFERLEEKPAIEVGFEVNSNPAGENLFEVNLHVTVKNSIKDRVLYFIELSYSSMVGLMSGNKAEENTEILIRKVPAHLFPFVRAIIAGLTRESGFPPFVLAPVDFDNVEIKRNDTQATQPANQQLMDEQKNEDNVVQIPTNPVESK